MDELQTPTDPDVTVSSTVEPDLCTEPKSTEASEGLSWRFDPKLYFGLLAASFLGTLAIIPYSMTLMKQIDLAEALLPFLVAVTVVVELLVSAVAIGLGLWLGPRVGLARLVVYEDDTALERSDLGRIWALWGKPLLIGMARGLDGDLCLENRHRRCGKSSRLHHAVAMGRILSVGGRGHT